MNRDVKLLLTVGALTLGIVTAGVDARQQGPGGKAEELVKIRLAGTTTSISPGERFEIAVVMDIERAWHIYWQNPGEGAPPPNVKLSAPSGFTVGEIKFPRPVILKDAVGEMYCHERQAVLLVPVTAPATLGEGAADFAADVRFAVCKELCLMGSAKASTSIPTTASSDAPSGEEDIDSAVVRALKRAPKPLSELQGAAAKYDAGTLRITGPLNDYDTVQFFPYGPPGVTFSKPKIDIQGDQFKITVRAEIDRKNLKGAQAFVGGLLGLGDDHADPSYEVSVDVD